MGVIYYCMQNKNGNTNNKAKGDSTVNTAFFIMDWGFQQLGTVLVIYSGILESV